MARLMAARAKAEAVRNMDRGDLDAAGTSLGTARFYSLAAPRSAQMAMELDDLANLDADLAAGDVKRAKEASHLPKL